MSNHLEFDELLCPTFTSYTADNSAQTAARVSAMSPYLEDDNIDFEFHLVPKDGDNTIASTSSDSDDVDGVATYCMWVPRKRKSSGSGSKKWKLLDLLRRSNSEGKGDFVFLSPNKFDVVEVKEGKRVKSKAKVAPVAPVEKFYVNRALKEGQKRKSYLPYKKDLVGFFR